MKKTRILMITAFFYPQNVIATSRVGQWVKYWARDGHEVTVLTTKKYPFWAVDYNVDLPPNVRIIETGYLSRFIIKRLVKNKIPDIRHNGSISILKKIKRVLTSLIDIDIHDFWPISALKAGEKILSDNDFDLIISSYSPASSHIIASRLRKRFPKPIWIADFRDLWAHNHIVSQSAISKYIRMVREKNIVRHADVLTTVSEPLADILKKSYPEKKVSVIENGFDPDDYPDMGLTNKNFLAKNKTIITYTGMIYQGKQDPSLLLCAVNELIEENKIHASDIEIHFYGQSDKILSDIVKKGEFNRYGMLSIHGVIPRTQSIERQKNSDLLLLLGWNDPSAKGVLTGKIFEYIASGVPILGIGITNQSSVGQLIEQTRTGFSSMDKEEVKQVILEVIRNKKVNFYKPDIEKINLYRRDVQARRVLSVWQ